MPWSGFKQSNLFLQMHSQRIVKSAALGLLGLGAAFSLNAQTADSSSANSQQSADSSNPQVLEKFVVTGSNIPSADTAIALP